MNQTVTINQSSAVMMKTGIMIGVGLIGLVALILLLSEPRQGVNNLLDNESTSGVTPVVDQQQLAADYRQAIKQIIVQYNAGGADNIRARAESARSAILALSVPSDAREVHLAAAVALGALIDQEVTDLNVATVEQTLTALQQY